MNSSGSSVAYVLLFWSDKWISGLVLRLSLLLTTLELNLSPRVIIPSVTSSSIVETRRARVWERDTSRQAKMASNFSRVLSSKRNIGILSVLGGSVTAGFLLHREHVSAGVPVRRRYPARYGFTNTTHQCILVDESVTAWSWCPKSWAVRHQTNIAGLLFENGQLFTLTDLTSGYVGVTYVKITHITSRYPTCRRHTVIKYITM